MASATPLWPAASPASTLWVRRTAGSSNTQVCLVCSVKVILLSLYLSDLHWLPARCVGVLVLPAVMFVMPPMLAAGPSRLPVRLSVRPSSQTTNQPTNTNRMMAYLLFDPTTISFHFSLPKEPFTTHLLFWYCSDGRAVIVTYTVIITVNCSCWPQPPWLSLKVPASHSFSPGNHWIWLSRKQVESIGICILSPGIDRHSSSAYTQDLGTGDL